MFFKSSLVLLMPTDLRARSTRPSAYIFLANKQIVREFKINLHSSSFISISISSVGSAFRSPEMIFSSIEYPALSRCECLTPIKKPRNASLPVMYPGEPFFPKLIANSLPPYFSAQYAEPLFRSLKNSFLFSFIKLRTF